VPEAASAWSGQCLAHPRLVDRGLGDLAGLDLVRAGVIGTLPVIFYIRGAGWAFGDAHTFERLRAGDVDIVQERPTSPRASATARSATPRAT
jgi:hypothetical protein